MCVCGCGVGVGVGGCYGQWKTVCGHIFALSHILMGHAGIIVDAIQALLENNLIINMLSHLALGLTN